MDQKDLGIESAAGGIEVNIEAAESSSCFVDIVVVVVVDDVAAAEPSWPSEHWSAVLCCLTLQKGRVDQMDYVESFQVRILYYIPHSAAVFVFWKRHLHTSCRVIAC